jgi:VanZ family protein
VTPRRWRTLLFVLMAAGMLMAVRPLSGRSPETLFPHADKIVHVLFFAGMWWLARRGGFAAGWPLALALLGYGVSIEVAQALTPTNRSASLSDVAADAVGIALAWGFTRGRSGGEPAENRR